MNAIQFLGAVELGLIYACVTVAVYLSFRCLDFPDLSVDGTFPLGAAICAVLIVNGFSPLFSTAMSVVGGLLAGYVTAWLSTKLKILNLLAGILTMTALYSVNLRVMKRPNVSLLNEDTFFTPFEGVGHYFSAADHIIPLILLILILSGALWYFLQTHIGLALRSVGSNPKMARAQGISDQMMIKLGVSLSNGFVALCGALFAQAHGFADVTMGLGTIIIGLASLIIGETLFRIDSVFKAIMACIVGSIVYRLVVAFALNVGDFGLQASDLNLVTAVIVTLAMVYPRLKNKIRQG